MPKNLLIVAHQPSPNTTRLAEALLQCCKASAPHLGVNMKTPFETNPNDVLACDAIILFTTENLAYMSGALKDFFDRCYYPVLEKKQGLPCCAIIRAGHDGTGTKTALKTIVTGLKWRWVQAPLVLQGNYQSQFIEEVETLGAAMAIALDEGMI